MKYFAILIALAATTCHGEEIKNRLIDYPSFQTIVSTMNVVREENRLSEKDFIAAISSKEYVLLDA
ncbi:MAG: hypothetical protein ACKVH8_05090 [Pirellulales bacterium]